MAEPWILHDHTWIEVRMKGKLLHSLNGRPIPSWMGGAIHLPSLFAALSAAGAGFVIFGIATIALLSVSNQAAMYVLLIIEVIGPLVAVYGTWQRTNGIQWARTQVDWIRQDRRSATATSGGTEPDSFKYTVILFNPVDAGWLALARAVRHNASRTHAQERSSARP